MSQGSTCLQRWQLAVLLLVLAALVPAWTAKDSKPDDVKKTKKGKKAKKEKEAAVPLDQGEIQKTKTFEWPDSQMGPRTSDRISAGKRAAKWISCGVCQERTFSLFLKTKDIEDVDTYLEEQAATVVGDVKELCDMKQLAVIFKARKLGIVTSKDGSALMAKAQEGESPNYDEINTSELAFDWKAFALQHACTETFRKDGDTIIENLKEAWLKLRANDGEEQAEGQHHYFRKLAPLIQNSCEKARMCKAELKLKAREEL